MKVHFLAIWCVVVRTGYRSPCKDVHFRYILLYYSRKGKNAVQAMIKNNRRSTTREIAENLNISHTCIERHLKQVGYVNKLDI